VIPIDFPTVFSVYKIDAKAAADRLAREVSKMGLASLK
jgi:hypothetical protein